MEEDTIASAQLVLLKLIYCLQLFWENHLTQFVGIYGIDQHI